MKLVIEGRHDPAIIHRARVVVDSVLALGVLDLLLEKEAASHFIKNDRRIQIMIITMKKIPLPKISQRSWIS